MSSRDTGVLSVVIVCGVLILLLLWRSSPWLLLPVVGAAIVIGAVLFRQRGSFGDHRVQAVAPRNDFQPPDLPGFPWPENPSEQESFTEEISGALLPSSREDYSFHFSATVVWETVRDESGAFVPEALAVRDVLRRAEHLTSDRAPEDVSMLRYELAAELAVMCEDRSGTVRSMARAVCLELSEGDRALLTETIGLRKQQALWQYRSSTESELREYLGEDVLRDKGSAIVWWMARMNGDLGKTLGQLHDLERLTEAVNGTTSADPAELLGTFPPDEPVPPAQHLSSWVDSLEFSLEERELFLIEHLRGVLTCDRPDQARAAADFLGIDFRDVDTPAPMPESADQTPSTEPESDPEAADAFRGKPAGFDPRPTSVHPEAAANGAGEIDWSDYAPPRG